MKRFFNHLLCKLYFVDANGVHKRSKKEESCLRFCNYKLLSQGCPFLKRSNSTPFETMKLSVQLYTSQVLARLIQSQVQDVLWSFDICKMISMYLFPRVPGEQFFERTLWYSDKGFSFRLDDRNSNQNVWLMDCDPKTKMVQSCYWRPMWISHTPNASSLGHKKTVFALSCKT
jgi:hypothetical protein